MRKKLCQKCQKFTKKFKPWNEKKVPKVAIVDYAECKKCKITYQIYSGMIWAIPMASKKQLREMKADGMEMLN